MEPEYSKKALDSDTEMKEAYSENSDMKKTYGHPDGNNLRRA